MNAWRACVRLWAFGSATWLAFWIYNASQCTEAVGGYLLCPTTNGEGVVPTTYPRLALTVLGPPLSVMVVGLALLWWNLRADDSQTGDGSR